MTEKFYKQLPKEIIDEMSVYGKQSRELQAQNNFTEAEVLLLKIWNLLPEPKFGWGNTNNLLYGIVDFYRRWGKHEVAKKWIAKALEQDLQPHEYIQYLEAGKTYFEAGEFDTARGYFEKAFKISGARGFSGEDPKYLKFYREKKN
jgi:tetratricopeptide (TPR) repeat protein